MPGSRNQVATKLVETAYKLHKFLYGKAYPYPLNLSVIQGKISVQTDNIFRFKYVPFVVSVVIITGLIGNGCCIFVPLYKLFSPSSIHFTINPIFPIIASVFLALGFSLEGGVHLAYCKATEIETMTNQLFEFERNCKFISFYKLTLFVI